MINAADIGITDLVSILINKGVDVNAKNKFGETALSIAQKKGYNTMATMLRSAGLRGKRLGNRIFR